MITVWEDIYDFSQIALGKCFITNNLEKNQLGISSYRVFHVKIFSKISFPQPTKIRCIAAGVSNWWLALFQDN